jgi:hypothetical protein
MLKNGFPRNVTVFTILVNGLGLIKPFITDTEDVGGKLTLNNGYYSIFDFWQMIDTSLFG